MARGGKRPGAGKKKGTKHKKTIEKQMALERLQQRVYASQDVILNAQLSAAIGLQYLYRIDYKEKAIEVGKGDARHTEIMRVPEKPVLVTDQEEIEQYLSGDADKNSKYYFLTTEKPSVEAIKNLWERAFGKAEQPIDLTSKGQRIGQILDDIENE
jgi:hypothetical protein